MIFKTHVMGICEINQNWYELFLLKVDNSFELYLKHKLCIT